MQAIFDTLITSNRLVECAPARKKKAYPNELRKFVAVK